MASLKERTSVAPASWTAPALRRFAGSSQLQKRRRAGAVQDASRNSKPTPLYFIAATFIGVSVTGPSRPESVNGQFDALKGW